MTTQKDFKRLVRGRMQKTGESYTAARAHLISGNGSHSRESRSLATVQHPRESGDPVAPKATPPDLAKIAGMSDATIKEKTGCTWEKWVWALDQVKAYNWPHTEIARYVHEKYDVPGWWTQSVTVGYERIKGLREKGQRRSGSWEASKSKTIDAAVGMVFRAFKQPKLRTPWLDSPIVIRTAVPNKSLRITWEDGSSVEVYLTPKGRSKTVAAVQHTKLKSKQDAESMKAFWTARLEDLASRIGKKT